MNRTRCALPITSLLFFGLALSACGGKSLERPESLPLRSYPAERDFRMSFVMTSCSDPCAEYEASDCSVDVDTEDRVIEVSVSIGYSDREGVDRSTCALACGKPVLGHCEVPALPAGTYTVVSGVFSANIEVR